MPQRTAGGKSKPARRTESAIEKFALALERGRFVDYIDQLQSTRTLLWKNFLIGLTRGFGAVVGATVVVTVVVTLLALIGDNLPGELGEFFKNTSQQINPIK